jgi:hypothetical protein
MQTFQNVNKKDLKHLYFQEISSDQVFDLEYK